MIARLAGILVERNPPHVIVDVNGVGYDVLVSVYTLASLPPDGERVTLRVFTQATENKIALYGFADLHERQLFDLLITVKNVGPSTAIAILSGSSPRDIAELVARGDVAGLTRIKGVGKKTAEMTVVELRDKCEMLVMTWTADGGLRPAAQPAQPRGPSRRHPLLDDVALALAGMGWRSNEVDKAVAELPPDLITSAGVTVEVLLRQALRSMPR